MSGDCKKYIHKGERSCRTCIEYFVATGRLLPGTTMQFLHEPPPSRRPPSRILSAKLHSRPKDSLDLDLVALDIHMSTRAALWIY
jgi:hypothetical protein